MKIRTDYVTNSSSSSFILSFKNEKSIKKTLEEQWPKDTDSEWSVDEDEHLTQLYNEILLADRLTHENIKNIVMEEEEYPIRWFLSEEFEKEGMSYSEAWNFLNTAEGQKMISDECMKSFQKVIDGIGKDKVIVQVEHGDGRECEDGVLEHEILPYLGCTVVRFSHH